MTMALTSRPLRAYLRLWGKVSGLVVSPWQEIGRNRISNKPVSNEDNEW